MAFQDDDNDDECATINHAKKQGKVDSNDNNNNNNERGKLENQNANVTKNNHGINLELKKMFVKENDETVEENGNVGMGLYLLFQEEDITKNIEEQRDEKNNLFGK